MKLTLGLKDACDCHIVIVTAEKSKGCRELRKNGVGRIHVFRILEVNNLLTDGFELLKIHQQLSLRLGKPAATESRYRNYSA